MTLPDEMVVKFKKIGDYKKAENPGEEGALYKIVNYGTIHRTIGRDEIQSNSCHGGFKDWIQVAGPETSWNNDREVIKTNFNLIKGYEDKPTAVVSKHGRLTGKAYAETIERAYKLARESHWHAAFGNVTVVNRPCTETLAKMVGQDAYFEGGKRVEKNRYEDDLKHIIGTKDSFDWTVFTDVFAAPSFEGNSLKILKEKQKTKIRVWEKTPFSGFPYDITLMDGVAQVRELPYYAMPINRKGLRYVTENEVEEDELEILLELARMIRPVGSNGIILGNGKYEDGEVTELFGLSDTDMFRSGAVHGVIHAAQFSPRAKEFTMLASDGFFPHIDNIEEAAKGNVEAIITPAGSVMDKKVIERANDYGMRMVFVDERLFAHP